MALPAPCRRCAVLLCWRCRARRAARRKGFPSANPQSFLKSPSQGIPPRARYSNRTMAETPVGAVLVAHYDAKGLSPSSPAADSTSVLVVMSTV
ncbi:uncharacterized protein BT62DRAFT_1006173 [Guyanagaster necrorhizus]|uniref:Uncharacterized protein n=1 Tax=Guyanagaster necrorhizus TaxID=856835 RepID=A0A9P7VSF8_9AGAR|nr:uncharacterized protein BT62DRAFT_1006173 [Guyanagaster necrorhizus MCA 3950]KAG7445997.1 hypothetical protein BT62DRAFT_1006173 [Guyanagaster necrorhizus MCA 3950]